MGKFTKKQREDILIRLNEIFDIYEGLTKEYDNTIDNDKEQAEKIEVMGKESQELVQKYIEGLPIVQLSKCPFTGEILNSSLDYYGLDGFWWNSDSPIRTVVEKPKGYFAFDGALKIKGDIEYTSFNVTPGPEKPFVRPRLLEDFVQVRAVLYSKKIGKHTAYFMFYFADPMLHGVDRINDYGTKSYVYIDEIGEEKIAHDYDSPTTFDYNLEYWIREGKLLWIHPDDTEMTLHGEVSGCPYLNLKGSENIKYIYKGQVSELDCSKDVMEAEDVDEDVLRRINEFVEREGNLDA